MTYEVADGDDNEAGFADVSPQPKSEGIKPTRRTYGADGSVIDEGKYVELEFNMLASQTAYDSLLTQFGVNGSLTNDVTVRVRDETWAFVNKNGTAIRPEMGRDARWGRFFPRNVVMLIRDLSDT